MNDFIDHNNNSKVGFVEEGKQEEGTYVQNKMLSKSGKHTHTHT